MDENDTMKALKDTYNELKAAPNAPKDALKNARNTIISLFPNVNDNNNDVWQAMSEKQAIKDFYTEYVAGDYAEERHANLDDTLKAVTDELHEFFNSIKGNPNAGGKKAFTQYLQELSDHDIKNDFQCGIFPATNKQIALNFPNSTLSFIAGRPSAGKTTALVSVAMYAMRHTDKKVLYITSEETTAQLITRFIKNQYCAECLKDNRGALLNKDFGQNYIDNVFQDIIKNTYKDESESLEGMSAGTKSEFSTRVIAAAKAVESYIKAGRLQLFDLDKTESFAELKDRLQELERYTVVIIDYMQNLPFAPNNTSSAERIEFIRQQVYEINKIIKANYLIGIAGAQMNREGATEYDPQPLELKNLGDCGELERKGVNIIGLGRKINDDNTKTFFYRVMKARYGEISRQFEIDDFYSYSFMQARTSGGELVPFNAGTRTQSAKTKKAAAAAPAGTGDVIDRLHDEPILI